MKNILVKLLILVLANSAHGQAIWQEIQTPTAKDLNVIQFVSNEVGFVAGDSVLMKTVDGGATWTEMILDSIPHNINQTLYFLDMHWFDENHGMLMAGPWGGFYETMDGGLNWEPVGTANSGFCQSGSLFFFDEANGFAGGAGCFSGHIIDRFENGTWHTTVTPNDWNTGNLVTTIEFKNNLLGFAGTQRGNLLRTDDGGLNWDTIPNLAGDSVITDFIFYLDGTIRATHQNNAEYGVMISDDDGLTWSFDNELASFFYPSMNAAHIDDNGTTYIAGGTFSNGLVFDNNAPFWNMLTVNQEINDIASPSDSITFLVGDSGAIYVNVDLVALGVEEEGSIEFDLAPNPATDWIEITGLEEGIEGYSIFDVSGRIVFESNQKLKSGISIDVAELKTGAYFISIQTPLSFGTKRFLKL